MTDSCPSTLSPDEIWLIVGVGIGFVGSVLLRLPMRWFGRWLDKIDRSVTGEENEQR